MSTTFNSIMNMGNMSLWDGVFLSPTAEVVGQTIANPSLIESVDTKTLVEIGGCLARSVVSAQRTEVTRWIKNIKRNSVDRGETTREFHRLLSGLTPLQLHKWRVNIIFAKPGLVEWRVSSDAAQAEDLLNPAAASSLRNEEGVVVGTITFASPERSEPSQFSPTADIVNAVAYRLVKENGGTIPDELRLFAKMDRYLKIWKERAGIYGRWKYGQCIQEIFLSNNASAINGLFYFAQMPWDGFGVGSFNRLLPAIAAVSRRVPTTEFLGIDDGRSYQYAPSERITEVMAVSGVKVYFRQGKKPL